MLSRLLVVSCLVVGFCFSVLADPPRDETNAKEKPAPFPSSEAVLNETTLQWIARQLGSLRFGPAAIERFNELAQAELSPKILDGYLWSFRGFLAGPAHRNYRMRQWVPVNVSKISRAQVEGMSPEMFATVVRIAMEIELPIMEYSLQSGAGFRLLHAGLGRFMGRDRESREYARQNKLPWCDGPWCAEEDRHGDALAVIFRKLIGREPARDNLAPTEEPLETLQYAIDHVDSRQSTEWIAAGSYYSLLPHCTGELHAHLLNVFRDEIKHLAIMSAFDRYLRGPQPWRRLKANIAWTAYRSQIHHSDEQGRSGIGISYSEPVFLAEFVYANTLEEIAIQRWLDTIPYSTLREIFEVPPTVPDFLSDRPAPSLLEKWRREVLEGEHYRLQMPLWKPADRRSAQELWRFLVAHRTGLTAYAREHLDGFNGCEEYDSPTSQRMRRRIRALTATQLAGNFPLEDHGRVRAILEEMLRTYQFENNHETRTFRGEIPADVKRFNTKSPKNLLFEGCGPHLAQ